jgi:C_GCAxxG_C_C family probable redox protein
MWEASDMKDEAYLWAGIPFMGGIAGHQDAPCGAVSASALFLGLKQRCSLNEKETAKTGRLKARSEVNEFMRDFKEQFHSISCLKLVGLDFTDPEGAKEFRETKAWQTTCDKYVQFALEKLYELNGKG